MAIRTTDTLDDGRITFREPDPRDAPAQVSDPVCGMDVDPQDPGTERSEHAGTTYYFCSAECKKQFTATPEQFISATI